MVLHMILWNDKRLRLSLTRLGMEYLAAMGITGAFAANSGNNLLYVIFALMLGLFLVSGWVSRGAIRDLSIEAVEEGNLFARVRGGIKIRFQDKAPRRIRGLEVQLELESGHVERGFYAGAQSAKRSEKDKAGKPFVTLHVHPNHRGWCRVKGLVILTRYPFGFLEKSWRFPLDQEILVLPHPRHVALHKDPRGEDHQPVPSQGESSPEGARPFQEGDSLNRVHWKRTAQRGTPWVRTFEGEQTSGLRMFLDLRAWKAGTEFERELERLSGAILQGRIHRREISLEITDPEGRRHILREPRPCWQALAQVQAEQPFALRT